MPMGMGGGVNSVVPTSTSIHGRLVFFPVSLASGGQDGGPSNSTIDIYDLMGKWGTLNSLMVRG